MDDPSTSLESLLLVERSGLFDVLINAPTLSHSVMQALTLFSAKLLLRIRMAVVADQTMSSDQPRWHYK